MSEAAANVPGPMEQPAVPAMMPMHQVAAKSPGLALVCSFFIPGLGTLVNGQAGKGIAFFVGYGVAVVLSLVVIGIPFAIGLWIWGMVDAYQGAKKWNTAHGIIS